MNRPQQFPFANRTAGPVPPRRPGSVRRTTSLDSHWPQGIGTPSVMEGRARNVLTPARGGPAQVLAEATVRLEVSITREILAIAAEPSPPRLQELVGVRAGGASRAALVDILGQSRGTPLFQLIDDFAGASLVSNWVWREWRGAFPGGAVAQEGRRGPGLDVCHGFESGGSAALAIAGGSLEGAGQPPTPVGELANPADPDAFHPLPGQSGPQARRTRWVEVWREDDGLGIAAGFQDSGPLPGGGRGAIHEYLLAAAVDGAGRLTALDAEPLTLPFRECPGAVAKAMRVVGRPIAHMRETVLELLPGTLGCTHLNDVLRALADVPVLAAALPVETPVE